MVGDPLGDIKAVVYIDPPEENPLLKPFKTSCDVVADESGAETVVCTDPTGRNPITVRPAPLWAVTVTGTVADSVFVIVAFLTAYDLKGDGQLGVTQARGGRSP